METSAIDAGNAFAAGRNNKTAKPASEMFSDLLSTLFSKLGQTAEDEAARDEPFFQAKPRAVERAAPERGDELARPDDRRPARDDDSDAIGYADAAIEQRRPVARSADDDATTDSDDSAKPAGDATARPTAPADRAAARPAPLAAPATPPTAQPGNAAQPGPVPPAQIQVTVNEAPVQAQPGHKLAADSALASQAATTGEEADPAAAEPRPAAPGATGLAAGKGEAGASTQAGAQGNGASNGQGNGQSSGQGNGSQAQPGFANLAAQMLQAAPAASAGASAAASGFAAALDAPDEAVATTLPLGATGATPASAAAAQRRAETAATPQLPRLPAAEQIAINIQKAVKAGKDQVTIKLQPEELGRIDVKLEVGDDGRVTAQVRAEKPETLELLQRDARGLERALQEAGLRADAGSLSFGLRGENRQQDTGFGQQPRSTLSPLALNAEQDDIIPVIAARSAEGRIDLHV